MELCIENFIKYRIYFLILGLFYKKCFYLKCRLRTLKNNISYCRFTFVLSFCLYICLPGFQIFLLGVSFRTCHLICSYWQLLLIRQMSIKMHSLSLNGHKIAKFNNILFVSIYWRLQKSYITPTLCSAGVEQQSSGRRLNVDLVKWNSC